MTRKFTMLAARSFVGLAALGTASIGGGIATAGAATSGGLIHYYEIDEPNGKAIALVTGALADSGVSISPENSSVANLKFKKGSWKVDTTAFNKVHGTFAGNKTNCSQTYTATAPAPIIAGSGTGAYAGIKGTLTATIHEAAIGPKLSSGKCNENQNSEPVFSIGYITASGTVSFP